MNLPRFVRWHSAWFTAACLLGLCSPALGGDVQVLESAGRGVTIRVSFGAPVLEAVLEGGERYHKISVEGCGWSEVQGRPRLPVKILRIGIPFGVEPRVRVVSREEGGRYESVRVMPVPVYHGFADQAGIDRVDLELRPDPAVYGRPGFYPEACVEPSRTATLRFQHLLEVSVYPARWKPATGQMQWLSSIIFEITWEGGQDLKHTDRAPEEPLCEDLYERMIVNAAQARPWRWAPLVRSVPPKSPQQEFKLTVQKTGLYRIDYSDLTGFPAPVPIENLEVYRKQYASGGDEPYEKAPVSIKVLDVDENGLFDGSDHLYFWGRGFREAFVVRDYEDRYTDENVYWLGVETGGARMDSLGLWSGAPAETLRVFPETLWFEEDNYFWADPSYHNLDDVPPDSDLDWWYWISRVTTEGKLPFEAYDVCPDSIPRLTVRFQGHMSGTHGVLCSVLNGRGDPPAPLDEQQFDGFREYFYETRDLIPAGYLSDGVNYFQFDATTSDRAAKKVLGAWIDWIEVRYARELIAREDYLHFNTGRFEQGMVSIGGFADSVVYLVDVTRPADPTWLRLDPQYVEQDGVSWRVVFPLSDAGDREFVVFASGGAKDLPRAPDFKNADPACWAREGDYLAITHAEFKDEIGRLAALREAQGFQTQVIDVEEVYDAFSGGIKDPFAIRRYLKWGFDHWATKPLFAVLVGDGSDDHRSFDPDSGPDFIPSMQIVWADEIVPADNWYADLDDDYNLDLYLGRLPVGSTSELESLIDKIVAYEDFDASDSWRGRVLAVADDRSSTASGGIYRCPAPGEDGFELAARYSLERAMESPGAVLDTIGLYMSQYTGYTTADGYHASCFQEGVQPLWCSQDSVRSSLTPVLMDILNEGVMLFQFQGHGNRKVMSHEYILIDGTRYNSRRTFDLYERLSNDGMPFICATFGCHFADFSEVAENDETIQESLVEKAVLKPNGGAIAGIGPVGFEYFDAARQYQEELAAAFFDAPPSSTVDVLGAGARWLFGEVSSLMIHGAGVGRSRYRWVLLGDPALRIDALAPGFTVTVDGAVVSDGDLVSSSGDSSSVQIRARIGDEVAIDTSSVRVSVEESGQTTPLVRGVDFEVVIDEEVSGRRVVIVEYAHVVRLADYDIVLEAQDRNGRKTGFTLKVRFFAYEAYFDGRRVLDGDYVSPDASVQMDVHFPTPVSGQEITVRVTSAGGEWLPEVSPAVLDPDGTSWRLTFALDGLSDGAYSMAISVDGLEIDVMTFRVEVDLKVLNLANYPNPFEEETDFILTLTVPAQVELRIFTIAGRSVRKLELDGDRGYNQIRWDGRDTDGDRIANGLYLYRVIARGDGRDFTSNIGRAVKIR